MKIITTPNTKLSIIIFYVYPQHPRKHEDALETVTITRHLYVHA